MQTDLDKLFEEISIYRQREDDITNEEFSDPYSDVWNFSVLLHIIPPYGPGTPDCGRLNLESIHIIRKNIERIIPMMTCFKDVSSIMSFNEKSQLEKMKPIMKKTIQDGFIYHIVPPYHTYIFSFNENFNTIGNQMEFYNLFYAATYKTLSWVDIIFNKGDLDLCHQCNRQFNLYCSTINTLLRGKNPHAEILNFIKNIRLYGTHKI